MVRCALLLPALAASASRGLALVNETVTVGGYVCPGVQTAWVVRPDDDGKYPVLSFAHGYGSGGDDGVKRYYTDIITHLAGMGYVVVALESASGLCKTEYLDQLHSLEWALGNENLLPHIDQTAGTGLVGQSMGGGSTVLAASQDATATYNVKMAMAIHPMQYDIDPKVPIFFINGDLDTGRSTNPKASYEMYNQTQGVEKLFVEVKGAVHCDCCDDPYGDRIENPYIYNWVNCKMKADATACALVTTCTVPNITVDGYGCHYDSGVSRVVV